MLFSPVFIIIEFDERSTTAVLKKIESVVSLPYGAPLASLDGSIFLFPFYSYDETTSCSLTVWIIPWGPRR